MNEIKEYGEALFEKIKHIDEDEKEYWSARELKEILNYTQWRRFNSVIDKAKIACINSEYNALDHFADVGKMVVKAIVALQAQ